MENTVIQAEKQSTLKINRKMLTLRVAVWPAAGILERFTFFEKKKYNFDN
jgi:hypothetical protein